MILVQSAVGKAKYRPAHPAKGCCSGHVRFSYDGYGSESGRHWDVQLGTVSLGCLETPLLAGQGDAAWLARLTDRKDYSGHHPSTTHEIEMIWYMTTTGRQRFARMRGLWLRSPIRHKAQYKRSQKRLPYLSYSRPMLNGLGYAKSEEYSILTALQFTICFAPSPAQVSLSSILRLENTGSGSHSFGLPELSSLS